MSMTEREKFMARLEKDRKDGLVDLKFFFRPSRPFTPEEIFGAMNQVEEAVHAGHCTRHTQWAGNTRA